MGVLRQHHRRLSAASVLALLFFAFASSSATAGSAFFPTRQLGRSRVMEVGGVVKEEREATRNGRWLQTGERVLSRTRLAGPGSFPPTCRSKCGRCSPCKAVRVPIQPGRSIILEYYPEAWRCKCGNKFFMP